ncbi:MAG: glycosyltransferase family 4 protein [Halobacteriota archaeon]
MRFAFVTFEYPPFVQGGAGVYAENITKELARLGNEVHVITPKVDGSEEYKIGNGIFIHRINFINKPLLSAPSYWIGLKKQFKIIEQDVGGFDVVHGNAVSDFSLIKKMVNVPRIITVHHLARDVLEIINPTFLDRVKHLGGEIGMTPFIEKICIERADKIITVSEYTKRKLVSLYNISLRKIEVIYNGDGKKNFRFSENEKSEVKEKYSISNDKPVLLFVGRVDDKRKGLDFLLKAFEVVLSKIDANLVVVGSGNKEPYKRFSSSLGIGENVIFTGYVDDLTLRKFYSIFGIHVAPSIYDIFGNVVLEACACGTPVIVTDRCGIADIVDGEMGYVIEYDKDQLRDVIIKVLSDEELWRGFGVVGKQLVREKFGWNKIAIQIENIYKYIQNGATEYAKSKH